MHLDKHHSESLDRVGRSSIECDISIPTYTVPAHGLLKNYNTIEDFKAADKTALFNQLTDEVPSALLHSD